MSRVLLFCGLLLVPLAGLYESVYLGALLEMRWRTVLGEAGEFLGDAAPGLQTMCEDDARLTDSRLCQRERQVAQLRLLSGVALAFALALPLTMYGWALAARLWRPLLGLGPPLCWAWLGLMLLALLADIGVATLGALTFETGLRGQMFPLAATAIGLAGGTALLLVAMVTPGVPRTRARFVIATLVESSAQPRLAALVGDLAARLGAWPPEHYVLGLQPAVYATGARHYLHPAEQELSLPLLYVSLPLLRALTREELVALLAHELAHWSVHEQRYSRSVHPALAELQRALQRSPGGLAGMLRWPANTVLGTHAALWRRVQSGHERMRELLADEAAVTLVDPAALARALVKLAVLESEWRAQDGDLEQAVVEGRRAKNLGRVFERRLELLEPRGWLREMAESRAPHPCDRHEALFERVRTIGKITDDAASVSLKTPAESAIALLDDAERVEESLSDAQHFLYKERVKGRTDEH